MLKGQSIFVPPGISVQFFLRGHEWILLKNVYINMASVKIFFLSQSFFFYVYLGNLDFKM